MANKLERLAITCGGTGGHFNPGLSVAQALNARGGEAVLLLGGKHADKQLMIAEDAGVKAYKIDAVPIPKNPLNWFSFLKHLQCGKAESRRIMREHGIQALLSMGAYTSIPPVLAARSEKLPLFLHDGNARLGKANIFMSRFAEAVALSFPAVNAKKLHSSSVLTGFPLRASLLDSPYIRTDAFAQINTLFGCSFSPEKPLLLVFGGSLGAEKINTCISLDPGEPASADLQVIHLAGPGKADSARTCYAGMEERALVLESFENMALLYSAADFVISRSGGSTVSELAYFGKYALLIPYPFAAERHQDDNAAWLAEAGGAEIVQDSDCSPELFRSILARWLRNKDQIIALGEKSRAVACPDAAGNVLRMIESRLS